MRRKDPVDGRAVDALQFERGKEVRHRMCRARVHKRCAAAIHDEVRGRELRTDVVGVDRRDSGAELVQFRGDVTHGTTMARNAWNSPMNFVRNSRVESSLTLPSSSMRPFVNWM